MAKELLLSGADVDGRSKGNVTALHGACMNGHLQVVRLLLEKGADPELVNGYNENAIQVSRLRPHVSYVVVKW